MIYIVLPRHRPVCLWHDNYPRVVREVDRRWARKTIDPDSGGYHTTQGVPLSRLRIRSDLRPAARTCPASMMFNARHSSRLETSTNLYFFMRAYHYVRQYKDRLDISMSNLNDPYIFGQFYRNSKPAPMLLFPRAPRNETDESGSRFSASHHVHMRQLQGGSMCPLVLSTRYYFLNGTRYEVYCECALPRVPFNHLP